MIDIKEECDPLPNRHIMKIDSFKFTSSIKVCLVMSRFKSSLSIDDALRLRPLSPIIELLLLVILFLSLHDCSFIYLLDDFDKIRRDLEGSPDGIPPASEHIVCNILSVHVHPVDVDLREVKLLVNAGDDLFLKHFLADLGGSLLIRFHVLKDPPVDVPAVDTSNVSPEPSVFVIHDSNIVSNQFSPIS